MNKLFEAVLQYRKNHLQQILMDNGVTATNEELEILLSEYVAVESERRGWIDLDDFEPHELVGMLNRLRTPESGDPYRDYEEKYGEDFSVEQAHSPEWYLQNGTWTEVHAALQQIARKQVILLREKVE
ncbi:MAG: hypothetical protein WC657_05625 [Candidatus Paceibacterota bacterium]|jgi:hypothetical protein